MFKELHDLELGRSWLALITPALMQDEKANVRVIRLNLFSTPGNNDFEATIIQPSLKEDIFHQSVVTNTLAIDHRIIRPDGYKSTRLDACQIRLSTRFPLQPVQ